MAENPTDYEEALMKTVDEIWTQYDKDGNGVLDKTEMRSFVEATITQSGVNKVVTDEEFNQIFAQFDLDSSSTIEKDEMRENKRDRGNNNSPAWGSIQ